MGDRPTVPDRSIAYFKLASINTSRRKLLVVTSPRHQSNHSTIVVISSRLSSLARVRRQETGPKEADCLVKTQ